MCYSRISRDGGYNVNGKVNDEWFMRLSHKYELEQEELKKQTLELKNKLDSRQGVAIEYLPSAV